MEFIHEGRQYDSNKHDSSIRFENSEGKTVLKEFFGSDCYDFDIKVDEDLSAEGFFGVGHLFTLYSTKRGNFFVVFFGTYNNKKKYMVLDRDRVYRFLESRSDKQSWARDWLNKYFSIEEA